MEIFKTLDIYLMGALALTLLIILITIIVFIRYKHKPKPLSVTSQDVLKPFGENNIKQIDFIRNKIVVTVNDHKKVNLESLKAMEVEGINVVGNKVKFYFTKDTEQMYQQLKNDFEG